MIKKLLIIFSYFLILTAISANAQIPNIRVDSLKSVELSRSAILFSRQGLYSQALPLFYESLIIRKKIYGDLDPKLAGVYLNIGITYKNLGNLDLALKNYYLAERCYGSPNLSLFINIGSVYRSKLDFRNALKYYYQALDIALTNENYKSDIIASINYNIAEIYYLSNNYDMVIKIAKDNIKIALIEDQILYYSLLAFVYQVTNDVVKAISCYQKNIELTKKIYNNSNIELTISLLDFSSFLISNHQFSEARKNLDQAFEIIRSSGIHNNQLSSDYYKWTGYWWTNVTVATENISTFKKQKKQNLEKALEWYKKSLNELNFSFETSKESDLTSANYVSLINCIAVLKLVADVYKEIDLLEKSEDNRKFSTSLAKAIETYQIIGTLVQRARKEISNEDSKMELTKLEYATFSEIIQASHTAYTITNDKKYLELAFQNAERLKSSSLFDKISSQLAAENSLIPDSLLEKEFILNNEIASYNEKLILAKSDTLTDSLKIAELNNQIFAFTRQRDELNRLMETEYKDYYELKYSKSILSAREVCGKLKENDVIVEYFINENDSSIELYSFLMSKNKLEFKKQILPSKFNYWVEDIFQFMSDSEFLLAKNRDAKEFSTSSFNLYRYLIQPYENELNKKNITIIPDGKLNYIPFDVLLTSLPDTTKNIEFNKLNYLIKNYTFNYANSANLLVNSNLNKKKNNNKTGAFAPIYQNGDFIDYAGQQIQLIPLPGIQKEVEKIEKLVSCELFTGNDATEDNFRKNAEKFDILHLAMHAFVNDSIPALSSFAFTQTKSDDLLKNGLLNTADIYNLKLNANLTVLSSCNTGTGSLQKGEGIMSLARGFLYAGCPSIIMSLWEVEDNSGTVIITSFYKHLKRGKAKDEALRDAKLEYLESVNSRMAHPHYWSGFISLGNDKPMFVSYDFYFFIVLIVALAGIGIDQLIRIKKARKMRAS